MTGILTTWQDAIGRYMYQHEKLVHWDWFARVLNIKPVDFLKMEQEYGAHFKQTRAAADDRLMIITWWTDEVKFDKFIRHLKELLKKIK